MEIFLTVAEQLHFGRASRACHLSPSALTRAIQRMEQELGATLFIRDNRTVELSPAGERFRQYARRAVEDYRAFLAGLAGEQRVSGTLSLYASITAVYSVLPKLLETYRKTFPDVQLELRTGAAERAEAQIETGEIDVAVAALPDRQRAGLEFLPIMTTPLVFIAAGRASEAGQNIAELAHAPLIVPQSGLSRRRLDRWFKQQRIVPNISSEVSGNEAIIPMVHLGGGIGIVPQLVLERSPFRDNVVVLENAPVLEPYVVGLCSSRKNLLKTVVKAFWALAEKRSE